MELGPLFIISWKTGKIQLSPLKNMYLNYWRFLHFWHRTMMMDDNIKFELAISKVHVITVYIAHAHKIFSWQHSNGLGEHIVF